MLETCEHMHTFGAWPQQPWSWPGPEPAQQLSQGTLRVKNIAAKKTAVKKSLNNAFDFFILVLY
jgi:hypothetical protein